ncbi:HugZ family protein [Paracoccus sp. IB05]|uniref:HugZ family pyridoxamine 5'-phosphate oxidase n=1 Tax=Paracoccus sp. IB05 TaxID=2779367 RepID=UPI0018E88882|nr:pyridoxamine 5'-phosphate oxidase family protein [Paracoccus sp. IB05]MBJ2151180.1 pyridoxamine 5'-phosphate oxidase family protein [Paracoccus sp. IB05]
MPGIDAAITPRDIEINPGAAAAFDPRGAGQVLLHESRNAALSTLDPGGFPYGVVTNILPDYDGSPVFFTARLALHARNIAADDRVSLALAGFDRPDALTQPRMTLVGHSRRVGPERMAALSARFAARFPKAKLYLQLPDAALFRIEVLGVTVGGGPGRNAADIGFDAFRIDLSGAEGLIADEGAVLAELNAAPARLGAMAVGAGAAAGRWKAIALDPAGLILASGERLLRVDLPERVVTAAGFAAALARLAGG